MTPFTCNCGNALFFENSLCLQCNSEVGYDPVIGKMMSATGDYARCRNGKEFAACNWLVPANGPEYCAACALNHVVPDLSVAENLPAWGKMETAKRRALYNLVRLGIPPYNRQQRPDGLAFDFLTPMPNLGVTTGHEDGVITLNLHEADDLYRERQRQLLGEPYRTLIGHFRHELGHYYWDRFFPAGEQDDPLLGECRALFGDEREDYSAALARHYANGPTPNWQATHITSYATAHPWEDWAETWAQYLHIVDGLETAASFGWQSKSVPTPFTPFKPDEVLAETPNADASFLGALNDWAKLSPALNEMASSLGHSTLYPFVLTPQTVRKILFVHHMVGVSAQSWNKPLETAPQAPAPAAPTPAPSPRALTGTQAA